jgi:hypothetical protein
MKQRPTCAVWTAPPLYASSTAFFTTHGLAAANIEPLHGDIAGAFRLRLDDYRDLFTVQDDAMRSFDVRNRREAYR